MQRNDVSNKLLTSTRARLAEIGGTVASTEPQPCVSGVLHHPMPSRRIGGREARMPASSATAAIVSHKCEVAPRV